MEDLSGFWSFSEEFDCGKKKGELRLLQNENTVSGVLNFKEYYEDEAFLFVRCIIDGKIEGEKLYFEDEKAVVLLGGKDGSYLPEQREGVMNELGQIVGSVTDADQVNGVFVMEKIG